MKKALAFLMAAVMLMSMLTACGNKDNAGNKDNNDVNTEETDKAAADKVAALIDAIYVQERTEETDAQCEEDREVDRRERKRVAAEAVFIDFLHEMLWMKGLLRRSEGRPPS